MPSGMTVTNIRIATSESWKDKASGAQQERTEWHSIALFGRLGEIAAEYLRKGSQVFIEGKLRTRKWQDKQGNDRFTTEIVADNMQMLGGRGGGTGGGIGRRRARRLERRCASAGRIRSDAGAGRRQRGLRRRHPVLRAARLRAPLRLPCGRRPNSAPTRLAQKSAPEGADFVSGDQSGRSSELVRRADQEEPPHGAVLIERGVREFRAAAVGLQIHRRLRIETGW